MLRLFLIPLVLLALAVGAVFWSGGAAEPKADFTFITRGEIGTLDPNRMSWLQDIRIGYALWEGLFTLDGQTLEPIPGVAERIDVSQDQCTWTFHLRPAARWSNGDPVTAGDFVFAWRRMLERPGDYTYLLHCIRGAAEYQKAFASGSGADFQMVGVQAKDDHTLQVTLAHPVAIFPQLCAFPAFFPLHQASMMLHRDDGSVVEKRDWTRPPGLVTNGPFRLESWQFKRKLRLVASDYYWDRQHVRSRSIDVFPVDDVFAAFLKYDTGGADWLPEVAGDIAAELKVCSRPDLRVFDGFGTYFYTFNCRDRLPNGIRNPLADPRVRQALCMAVDKRFIVDQITRMGERPAVHYIPPNVFPGYASPAGLEFDVVRARQLLAEAGYPGGAGFPSIELLFNNEGHHGKIAEFVRRQWKENLGIDVVLAGAEIKTFRDRLRKKQYAVARASWIGDYMDPSTFTDKYLSSSENNDAAWASALYDDLCRQAAVEPNASRRNALFEQAEAILLREAPIMPLYHYVNVYLMNDQVQGIPLHPRNMVMLKEVRIGGQPTPHAKPVP